MKRSIRDLGDPDRSWINQVGQTETASRKADGGRESDQFIVLGDGRAVHVGKGLTGTRSPQRQTLTSPDKLDDNKAN